MLMVARTGNSSTMTTSTNTMLPETNYFSSLFKMNSYPNLLQSIELWSKNDVQKWIEHCIEEYSLGDVHLNDFEMNGKALLLLTEDNFKQRSSRSGDILHKALQQHRAMLKALQCQTLPFQLWSNFGFPPIPPPQASASSSIRRLNIPPPASSFPLSVAPFHPSAAGVLPHAAFNYGLTRIDPITRPSLMNNRKHLSNNSQQGLTRNRQASASSTSSSSHNFEIASVVNGSERFLRKSEQHHSGVDSCDVKREALSPSLQRQSSRQPTPTSSPITATTISPSVKQEYHDEEDVDIEQHDSAPTPPITSSSRSSSPKSSPALSKANPINDEGLSCKIRSQLLSRMKQHPNDVTNTVVKDVQADGYNGSGDMTRQIRYYHDRIDFRGDILLKPPAAKNCRILWEFLYILLEDPRYESIIHWEDREKMIFRIIQADKLAALWGLQKNRLSMTYEKLSRGMRYYYSNNIISKEQSKRLLYRFMRSPDEIRKSMKRNGGTASMVYSGNQKKNSPVYSTSMRHSNEDISTKSITYSNHDESSSSSSETNDRSTSQVPVPMLKRFPMHPTSTATKNSSPSLLPNFNISNGPLFSTNAMFSNETNTFESKANLTKLNSLKNDQSNYSAPVSLDSVRDRSTEHEKQTTTSNQSATSTSAKRKQAVPLSLTARLSSQQHQNHSDQPLNLAVHKDEDCSISDHKKVKTSPSTTTA